MRHAIDMAGQRCGSLLVLARAAGDASLMRHPKAKARWLCRCDCGATVERVGADLRQNKHHMCDACLSAVRSIIARGMQPIGIEAARVARIGAPRKQVHCQQCGLIGEGGRRWLTKHRAESPECSLRRQAGRRRWATERARAAAAKGKRS